MLKSPRIAMLGSSGEGCKASPGGPGGGWLGAAGTREPICLAGGGAGCSAQVAGGAAGGTAGGAAGGTEAPQVAGGAATAASEFLFQPPLFQEFHSKSRQPSPLQPLPEPLQLLLLQSSPPLRFVLYESRHEAIVKEKAEIAN